MERRAFAALLILQGLLFLLLPLFGTPHAFAVLSSFSAEIAVDLLGGGESPLDGYDGVAAGPLPWALVELPWLALLGSSGLVHAIGGLCLALAATAASWLCARELLGERAALVTAALVAFPPPNTWVHQHYGAYHVLPLVTAPLGLWILLRAEGAGRRLLGIAVLGSSVSWSPGSVAVAGPLLLWWWARELRAGRGRAATALGLLGGLLALAPVLYKLLLHEPFAGLLPEGAHVARATKPFLVGAPALAEVPRRVLTMLSRDLAYGWHWGLHGFGALGPVTSAAAAAVLVGARGRALPWTLAAGGVVVVGVVTGWFVFHPGHAEPFERDARHIVGLTQALAFVAGAAALPLLEPGPPTPPRQALQLLGAGVLGLLVCASAVTQLRDLRSSAGFSAGTPFRLESRYVSGIFRAPHFRAAPSAGLASCRSEDPLRRADCRRGTAIGLGLGAGGAAAQVRASCGALPEDLRPWCWFGRGWAEAQLHFRGTAEAAGWCGGEGLPDGERGACLSGVGWAAAQDFGDRPGALARWLEEVDSDARAGVARGYGVFAGMLFAERAHAEAFCSRSAPRAGPSCRAGIGDNAGFMTPLR